MPLTRRELFIGALSTPLVFGAPDSAWLANTFRELHLDAHFSQLPAPYEHFDAEASAQILKDAGFQMVSFFAVCNAGYSYFPTKLGVPHPGLKRDFTGEFATALKKRGIRVLAYVSAGPDRVKAHPEWARLGADATPAAQMCLNSPWVEQVHIPQLKEIESLYDVDGFFLDNLLGKFVGTACYCKYCREAFGAPIPTSDKDPGVFEHHRWLAASMGRYAEKVSAALPGRAFIFTHLWVTRTPVKPPSAVNQIVWEPVPPYSGVHSLDFSLEARYLSSLPGIANYSCMATRGNGWGDYSLRDPAAFRHEAAVLLASGGRPYLSDDSYPSGNPDTEVYRVYGEVNRRTAELEPIVKGCVPVKDTAVLLSANSLWSTLPLTASPASIPVAVTGAHKSLVEEHVQFSILNSETLVDSLAEYKALIVPEQCILTEKECDAIRHFVRQGGALLVTADTGTRDTNNHPLADFALADVLGVRYRGQSDARRSYLRLRPGIEAEGIPRMDLQIRSASSRIETAGAKTLFDLVPPTGPKQAPAEAPDGPGITIHSFGQGKAIYCALPLFAAYHQEGNSAIRKLLAWMLHQAHPASARAILLENAPLNVEVAYQSRGRDRFVHLLNYTADKRMSGPARLQDFSPIAGIRVRLQCAAKPRRVLQVPENRPVRLEWKDGWARFETEPFALHGIYLIEG